MNYRHYHQRDPIKNYFPLPNEIFLSDCHDCVIQKSLRLKNFRPRLEFFCSLLCLVFNWQYDHSGFVHLLLSLPLCIAKYLAFHFAVSYQPG